MATKSRSEENVPFQKGCFEIKSVYKLLTFQFVFLDLQFSPRSLRPLHGEGSTGAANGGLRQPGNNLA